MAGSAQGAIGRLKSEIIGLEAQKNQVKEGKKQLQNAISGLKTQRGEVSSNLKMMYGSLDKINTAIAELKSHPAGPDHPQIAAQLDKLKAQKEQIINQIANLKSGVKTIEKRIEEFQERLGQLGENAEMIGAAVNARKAAMEKIAGQVATQIGLNSNRELGNKKA